MIDLERAGRDRVDVFSGQAPPSLDDLRHRARRRRQRLMASSAVVIVLIGLGLSFGLLASRSRPPTTVTVTGPSVPESPSGVARAEATQLVDAVVLPAAARRVPTPRSGQLAQPPLELGCSPTVDVSRYWIVAGSVDSLVAFLKASPPKEMTLTGSGGVFNGPLQYLMFTPAGQVGPRGSELLISFASLKGSVGVRADGIAVPTTATCVTHAAHGG